MYPATPLTQLSQQEYSQLLKKAAEADALRDQLFTIREKGLADEYDRLIRHMDAGGDFFEFQVEESRRRNGEQPEPA